MFAPRALLRLSASVCAPPTHLRLLSTSLPLASKASKARVASRPKNKLPGGSLASVPRGTGVGADPRLYAPDEPVVGRGLFEEEPASRAATTKVEGELLAAQGDAVGARAREVDEGLRGTGVAASTEAYPAGEQVVGRTGADGAVVGGASQAEGPQPEEETIYTANPPFNVPLMMTACFVFAVCAVSGADMARVGYAEYNEETEEYEIAPAWKRYIFASGFGLVAFGVVYWGALAPGRIVTKLTIRRPATGPAFPRDALLTLHTPITRFPGLSPRSVPLSSIHLLGPLSSKPKPYHPIDVPTPAKAPRNDPISKLLRSVRKTLIAPSKSTTKDGKTKWSKGGGTSHVPILIAGDRATYSLAIKRGPSGEVNDPKGAWCEDWDELEKALLDVKERK